MHRTIPLDIEAVLTEDGPPGAAHPRRIGGSRQGREILGYRFGRGARRVSLIGGCHADEPPRCCGERLLDAQIGRTLDRPSIHSDFQQVISRRDFRHYYIELVQP